MNHAYKSLWNSKTGTYVAVAENSLNKGKKSSSRLFTLKSAGFVSGLCLIGLSSLTLSVHAATGVSGGAAGRSGTAISACTGGQEAKANSDNSIAIGCQSLVESERGIAIGSEAKALGNQNNESIAIGVQSKAEGDQSVAIGGQAHAKGGASIAIGADDLDKVASKNPPAHNKNGNNDAYNNTDIAVKFKELTGDYLVNFENSESGTGIGKRYTPTTAGEAGISLGTQSFSGDLATAVGTVATAEGTASVALGVKSNAKGEGALAIGSIANAAGKGAAAIGINSSAGGENSVAIGSGSTQGAGAQASHENAVSIGGGAQATSTNATAIGAGAKATYEGGVALGVKSITTADKGSIGYDFVTGEISKQSSFVWKSTMAGVAVGDINNGITRQITGVAAGAADSDAVNVAQLKGVAELANKGWNLAVAGNNNDGENIKPGETATFAADKNLTVKRDGATITYATAKDVNFDSVTAKDASGNESVLSAEGLSVSDGAGNESLVHAGNLALTAGSNQLTLDAASGTLTGLTNTAVGPQITDFAKSGRAATEEQLQASAGSTSTLLGGGVKNENGALSGPFNVNNNNYTTVAEAIADQAAKSKTTVTQGENIVVSEETNPDGSINYQVATAKDVNFDSVTAKDASGNESVLSAEGVTIVNSKGEKVLVTAEGSIVTDKDGNKTVYNAAGSTVTAKDGKTAKLTAGQVQVGNGANSLVLDADTGTLNGLTNKAWDPSKIVSGQAATEDQLLQASAAISGKGLKFVGNQGQEIHKNLGETLTIIGGLDDSKNASSKNIRTVEKNGDLEIQLADALDVVSVKTGATVMNSDGITIGSTVSLTVDGLVIVGGPSITSSGISAGNKQITNVVAGTEDHHAVNLGQLKDVVQNVDDLGDRAVKYDGNKNDPKDQITLAGGDKGTVITNLADGKIESGSKDAVNGGQIHDMGQSIADGMGGNSKFENGQLVTELNVGDKTYNNVNDALSGVHGDLSNKIENVENVANAGWNVTDAKGNTSNIGPNGEVAFTGDKNISVAQTGSKNKGQVEISLNQDLNLNSITAVNVDATNVTANEVSINNGPVINQNGIDMRDKQITNVADGVAPKDAVNVSQLENVKNDLHTEIGGVRRDLHKVDRKLRAGIAAAMATAALPQAYLPGKSMVGIGGGTWNGESGVALGVSTITDNGKWVFKFSGNASTRGDYGGTVGAGYQW